MTGAVFTDSSDWDEIDHELRISCHGILLGRFEGKLNGFRQNARGFANPNLQRFHGRISFFPALLFDYFQKANRDRNFVHDRLFTHRWGNLESFNIDELVKSEQDDGFVKSSGCKARKN
jgi:hypothetical protein